jgi:CO/xanthine dehydrogenase Mo-binding subunit
MLFLLFLNCCFNKRLEQVARGLLVDQPFGVKAVAEIPMDGGAPAVGNAVRDALGVDVDVDVDVNPVTPERVWRAVKNK